MNTGTMERAVTTKQVDPVDPALVKLALVKARMLIEDPTHWVKGTNKTTVQIHDGVVIHGYCAYGALDEAIHHLQDLSFDQRSAVFLEGLARLNEQAGMVSVPRDIDHSVEVVTLNDSLHTRHEDIMGVFLAAIRAEAMLIEAGS